MNKDLRKHVSEPVNSINEASQELSSKASQDEETTTIQIKIKSSDPKWLVRWKQEIKQRMINV